MNNRLISLAAIFLILLGILSIIPIASATETFTDDFETDTVGTNPSGTGYTFTSTGTCCPVSTDFAKSGTHSVKLITTSSTGGQITTTPDLCASGTTYTFWIYFTVQPNVARIYFSNTANTQAAGIDFSSSGVDATIPTYHLANTLATNTWHEFTVAFNDGTNTCANGGWTLSSSTDTILNPGFGTGVFGNGIISDVHHINYAASPSTVGTVTYYTDNWGIPAYAGLLPSATYISSTNIAGLDIARNAGYVVLRNGAATHQHVLLLDGTTLTQRYDTGDGQCTRQNGVLALSDDGAAYLSCNSTQSPNALTFIDGFGNSYPFNCVSPRNYNCDGIITYTPPGPFTANDNNGLSLMLRGVAGKIQQSTNGNSALTFTNIAFTESSTGSNILDTNEGWHLDPSDGLTHEIYTVSSQADTTTSPGTACAYGNLKIFKALSGSPVKGYTITLNNNAIISGSSALPAPTFTQTFVAGGSSGALATARDISCGNDKLASVSSDTTQFTITDYNGNLVMTKSGLSGILFSAINGNGSYAAYYENVNNRIHLINAITGVELAFINSPETATANNHIFIDNCAQNLYLETTQSLYRYNITANTTGTPVSINQGTCISSSGITSTSSSSTFGSSSNGISFGGSSTTITNPFHASDDNPFGINITYVSSQLHISHEATAVFIGLIFVVIFTIWLWRGTGSPIIAILGAGLGLIVATMFGFINVWVIMVVVLFLIVILGKMIFGGFTGGEES